MKPHLWIALAVALGVGTGEAGGPARAGEAPITDAAFLADSLRHSAYQARASELALTRAKAEAVRRFADQVIAQERALRPDLHGLAVDNDVPLRFNREKGRQPAEAALAAVHDGRFDRAYLQHLTQDLKQWIDVTRRCAARSGGEAERDLAATMLPALRQRLEEANRLLKGE